MSYKVDGLQEKIERFSLIKDKGTHAEYNMEPFCPKCGCGIYEGTGNMASHPEHYEKFYCADCDYEIGIIDNSRFIHCLEFENLKVEI